MESMMKYAIEVEVNLTSTRNKKKDEREWRREHEERRREEGER